MIPHGSHCHAVFYCSGLKRRSMSEGLESAMNRGLVPHFSTGRQRRHNASPSRPAAFLCGLLLPICLIGLGCDSQTSSGSASSADATSGGQPDSTIERPRFDFRPKETARQAAADTAAETLSFPRLVDAAAELGVHHVYNNGASPRALMVESTGGGCGWLDFDRDGLVDLYLTQGGDPCPPAAVNWVPDQLYRQTSDGRFVNVFADAALQDEGFGHGVAAGDFNNDGFDDLFIANAGVSRLFLNLGDGTWQDTGVSLIGARRVWSSTPAWGDPDRDGDLDLYVCNYAIYDPCNPVECLDKDGIPSICHPRNVEPEPDLYFRNEGDGRLVECAQTLGLFGRGNKALGVVIADMNGDHWPDIYVANDTTANFLFINNGSGTGFTESAQLLGGAFSATGEPQASMGVAYGDYDRNGWPDLLLTHFTGESNTLYQNRGAQGLHDVSHLTGLREPSLPKLGFGTIMDDLNSDGHMDLFVTNGHIDPRYAESEGYEMVPQLFSFDGQRWRERPAAAGDFFSRELVGRAVGTADFDRDGDLDLCVVHHNSPVALLRNESTDGRTLMVRLIGRDSNRNAVNVRVQVECGGEQLVQELPGGTSYAASHERLLHFGLGALQGALQVRVFWPSGAEQVFEVSAETRALQILEGTGIVARN